MKIESIYPLTPLQQGILFHSLLEPGAGVYWTQLCFVLDGTVDASLLRKAWQDTCARHPALRTVFVWEKRERPLQAVLESLPLPWIELDWTDATPEEQEARLERFLAEDRHSPCDLARGPLMRHALIRLSAERYRCVWSSHHILFDGWSAPLVLGEVFGRYEAAVRRQAFDPPTARPFKDYVEWLVKQDGAASREFFTHYLSGFATPTPLPGDGRGKRVPGYAERRRVLPPETLAALRTFARERQVTLNTLVQAAWAILLHRHSGEADVLFGVTMSGRSAPVNGVESIVGLLINTLPLRLRVNGASPMNDWVREVHRVQSGLQPFEQTSLVDVQGWAEVPRDRPLFESLVVFENYPVPANVGAAGALRPGAFEGRERANYPLGLIAQAGDSLELRIAWDTGRFTVDTIERLLDQLAQLIAAIPKNAQQPIGQIDITTAPERQQLTHEWSRGPSLPVTPQPIQRLFERHAAESPDAIAILYGSETVRYRELDARANQIAHALVARGIGPEARVGIAMERSVEAIASILGVLKAGAAYVPLDPRYPPARLEYMLRDARLSLLLTQSSVAERFGSASVETLLVDSSAVLFDTQATAAPPGPAHAHQLAYIIYTSGSTGEPKGVALEHAGLCNLVAWQKNALEVAPGSRVLQFASLSFDASVWEIFMALSHGATLVLARQESLAGPDLAALMVQQAVTHATLPPAVLDGLDPTALPQLRVLVSAGEACRLDLVRQWAPGRKFINAYGPTETTVCASAYVCSEADETSPPIGKPLANVYWRVLDKNLQLAPAGAAGELLVGGAGLARGYAGRDELTASRFIADPFAPGQRLYRTGDLVRFRDDGNLEFLGRIDDQVKLRGFRIEPGEIEAKLREHAGVSEAAVLVREDVPGHRQLVAYLRAAPGVEIHTGDVREQLGEQLPEHMIPSAYVVLEKFPLSPSGKLDRAALPAPAHETNVAANAAPRSPLEEALAEVWRDVLKRPAVGIHDNFFHLGGHSLLATQAVGRIRGLTGHELPLKALFEHPTIAKLSAHLQTLDPESGRARSPAITPAAAGTTSPLSSVQEGMWIVDRMSDAGAAYNVTWAARLHGDLNVAALERSLQALLDRHEILRTRFEESDGAPVAIVQPNCALNVTHRELTPADTLSREQRLITLLEGWRLRPFDLSHAPLLRAYLVRLGPEEHVLLLTMHHIVSDGWSLGIIGRELHALYDAELGKRPAPAAPTLQFRDYAIWEKQQLASEAAAGLLDYWRERLSGLQPLELPLDRPRRSGSSNDAGAASLSVPPDLVNALRALARRENATLHMLLTAALQLVLMRWSGQEDIAVGTPASGRDRPELENLVGCLLNTLVLRTDLSGNPTFRTLLSRVRQTALSAYAHQDLPFDRLVAALRPQRELNRNPFFDVMINYTEGLDAAFELAGLAAETIPPLTARAKFDLTLYANAGAGGLDLNIVYRSDLFSAARMSGLLDQLATLLAQVAKAPDQSILDFSLRTEGDRRLLPDPAATLAPSTQPTVMDLFLGWARRAPRRPALRDGERDFTYEELARRAGSLSGTLERHGIARGEVVAILAPRGHALVEAMLGVLFAGGVFLLLDPALPRKRRQLMLEESNTRALLALPELVEEATQCVGSRAIPILSLEVSTSLTADPPHSIATESDAAYVFFTSGSTGKPKPILGCHRGLSHFVRWQHETFAISSAERVSQLIGLSFDPLLRDVFLPLTSGAVLCIPEERQTLEPLGWMQRERITAVHTTPTLLQSWLADVDDRIELGQLRWLFVSGEPLNDTLVEAWRRRFGHGAQFVNLYGPTETTLAKCHYVVPHVVVPGVQPLGRAMPGSQALVLSPQGHLCAPGETGEIVIRTPFRSLGYLNRPEENRQAFRPNPFRDDPEDLLYFTGDLGRYRPDGLLEFAGRKDDQIKIHGVRVEPAEVTATLVRHPGVRNGVVVARRDEAGHARLIAYLESNAEQPVAIPELRAWLEAQLPAAFVPAAFVVLDALPLLPNGKIDRKALPQPPETAVEPEQYVAPRSPLEQSLQEIWSEVLHIANPSTDADFFEIGGHSLLATQVVSRVRHRLHVELPLRALFEHRTIASLAAHLGAMAGAPSTQQTTSGEIARQPRDVPLPLSFSQQRMWFVQQREPAGTAYNMTFAVTFSGRLDVTALSKALAMLVERHEAFRTTFVVINGAPLQRIAPTAEFGIEELTLQPGSREQRLEETRQLFRERALRPFDLATGPLHRLVLAQIDANEHALLWLIHHTIGDQWAAAVLWNELSALYEGLCRGETVNLPPLTTDYADFAVWQREYWTGERLRAQLAYWTQTLAGMSPLALPTDFSRPPEQKFGGARVALPIAPATLGALRKLATAAGATPFMALLTCLKMVLARNCTQDDIVVGTPIANRTRLETENLVGTLVNTLVIRTDLGGDPTFSELLGRVRTQALDAFAHQDLPFERLVEELVRGRDTGQTPLVQVLFNVPNAPMRASGLPGVDVTPFHFDRGSAQFDLAVSVDVERSIVSLAYSTELFEAATAQRFIDQFLSLLGQVAADPARKLSEYRFTSEEEADKLLRRWNETDTAYPADTRTDELIAAQASRTPEAIAVSMGAELLTYAQLDAAANQLAHYLQRLKIGPNTQVGVCMERSPRMVVALLAVMKAGATYVPLDPAFPPDRLTFMSSDAELAVVLTQSVLLAKLPPLTGQLIAIDRCADELAQLPTSPAPTSGNTDALAYVLYTSGSTGKPKGVEIPHRALTNFLCSMRDTLGCTADDRLLAVTTLSFDISGLELFLPLVTGARVEIASRTEATDGRLLIERLRKCSATILQATPTTWRMLIDAGWRGSRHLTALCGGEPLPPDLVPKLLDRCKALWNLYGPTETTIWSTAERIEPGTDITIGRPIANTTLYILDKSLQPVPVGVAGELYIGGDGLARGYRNRPDLTQDRFIPHPFSTVPGARIYRTGDLARYRPDGRVQHLGRVDFQVKIRGFRIELGEIETVLAAQPQVDQAVVATKDDGHGGLQLVAYLIRRAEASADLAPILEAARAKLPAYMIPAHFVWLDAFPLTANRKIDRNALPAPTGEQVGRFAAPVAPNGRLEVQLAALWRQVLGDNSIGVRDSFFDRGGHSLTAVQLLSQIERITGRQLPLATLFQAPTVAQMAEVLQKANWDPPWRSLVAIQPSGNSTPVFAIPGVGGNVLMFAQLAKLLGNDRPLYGLQARGLDSADQPYTSIQRMAAHYIREIRTVQPNGPYLIAGACTGGVVAYEMAAQLRAENERVSLALIESWHPSSARRPLFSGHLIEPLRWVASRAVSYSAALWRTPVSQWPSLFMKKLRSSGTLVGIGSPETLSSAGYYRDRVTKATWYAVSHYKPKPLSGSLLHVIASRRVIGPRTTDTRRMWEKLVTGSAEVQLVDAGDSGQMFFSPHVEALAAHLRRYFQGG